MAKFEEMAEWLRKEGLGEDVVTIFLDNKIDTTIFLELDNSDFGELGVLALGDKKRLALLKQKILENVFNIIIVIANSKHYFSFYTQQGTTPPCIIEDGEVSDLDLVSSTGHHCV